MTILLSTLTGGGGAGGLIFPAFSSAQQDRFTLKLDSAISTDTSNSFWAVFDTSHTAQGYETVRTQVASDATEQTILNITTTGVLTNIICPSLSSTGTMTLRLTIDGGAQKTFVSAAIGTGARFVMGAFGPGSPTSVNGVPAGLGTSLDFGYSASTSHTLPTPVQSLAEHLPGVGLVFKTSLVITIQGSVSVATGQNPRNALSQYVTIIPEGLTS